MEMNLWHIAESKEVQSAVRYLYYILHRMGDVAKDTAGRRR